MKAEEHFCQKTFIIINEINHRTVQCRINVPYSPASRQFNFSRAISQIHTHFVNLHDCQVFYFDSRKRLNVFVDQFPFHREILLPQETFQTDTIQVQYRRIVSQKAMNEKPCPSEPKKKKVKERTIRQAVEAVTTWRELYEQTDEKGKRVYTLETAAQKVGFAKKTLDDYFNQLRLAQYYQFNFDKHQFDKIGVLRRFVKQAQKKQNDIASLMIDENEEKENSKEFHKYFNNNSSDDDS